MTYNISKPNLLKISAVKHLSGYSSNIQIEVLISEVNYKSYKFYSNHYYELTHMALNATSDRVCK